MRLILTKILGICATLFALGTVASGQSSSVSYSAPMGFYRLDLEVGYQAVGVSVINAPAFGSWIESSTSSTLTSTDLTAAIGALLDSDTEYYVEIVEGPNGTADDHVGHRFEVDVASTKSTADRVVTLDMSSDNGTVSPVDSNPPVLPALAGYRFVLREHITLEQAFDPLELNASTNFASADQVQFFNGVGFSTFYVLGNSSAARWAKQGSFDDRGDEVIPPGQGLIFKRNLSAVTLRVKGMARTTPFRQRLASGFSLVAEGFPVSKSFDSRNALPTTFSNLDRAQIYNGVGFVTYQLRSSGSNGIWLTSSTGLNSQNGVEIFDYRGGVFLDLTSPANNYVIQPPPYAPSP